MPKMFSETAAPCQRTTLHGPTMGTRWSVSADVGASVNLAALRQDLAAAVQQVDATTPTRSFTPESPHWYASQYPAGLPAADGPGPSPEQLLAHLPPPDGGAAAGARGHALHLLVRLRNLPVLSGLARAIPAHWQRQVKTWLRG